VRVVQGQKVDVPAWCEVVRLRALRQFGSGWGRSVVMQGGIFISYQGADSHSYGALLYTKLSRHFGPDLVFLDSESIPAGADFVREILGR
jgi:hypothetical protein